MLTTERSRSRFVEGVFDCLDQAPADVGIASHTLLRQVVRDSGRDPTEVDGIVGDHLAAPSRSALELPGEIRVVDDLVRCRHGRGPAAAAGPLTDGKSRCALRSD